MDAISEDGIHQVSMSTYLELYKSGELKKRIEWFATHKKECYLCPKSCAVNREIGQLGFCKTSNDIHLASALLHYGEEPPISGINGSGTIFFAYCTLHCVYCQNYQISQLGNIERAERISIYSIEELASKMLYLQKLGAHNINLVTPTHYLPSILESLYIAISKGLIIPIVYNTSGFERVEILRKLEGIVDIYLIDSKYASDDIALKYSSASNYVSSNKLALKEIFYQVGKNLLLDDNGIALRGMIIRHLILPNNLAGTKEILNFIASELSSEIYISLMSQYFPTYNASNFNEINRRISMSEYEIAVKIMEELKFTNGWIQEAKNLDTNFRPDFEDDEVFRQGK